MKRSKLWNFQLNFPRRVNSDLPLLHRMWVVTFSSHQKSIAVFPLLYLSMSHPFRVYGSSSGWGVKTGFPHQLCLVACQRGMQERVSGPGFFSLDTTDIWGLMILWGCPGRCKMLSSIPGLYLLEDGSCPQVVTIKESPVAATYPLGKRGQRHS